MRRYCFTLVYIDLTTDTLDLCCTDWDDANSVAANLVLQGVSTVTVERAS